MRWFFSVIGCVICSIALAQEAPLPHPVTLADAVALAEANHPALRGAAGAVAQAEAVTAQARAAQRTTVRMDSRFSLTSEVPEIAAMPGGAPISLGEEAGLVTSLGAQRVLYSGGRLAGLERQARLQAQATEAMALRTRQHVRYDASRTYYLLLAAQRERDVAQQALSAAEEHLAVAQARLAARAAPKFDVLRAEVQVEEARQDVVRAAAGQKTAHAAFLRALGLPAGAYTASETEASAPTPVPPVDTLIEHAYAHRPELVAAERRIAAAEAALQVARAERSPTVSLAGDYQLVTPESATQLSRFTLAVVAGLPLVDGGASAALMQQAEAQRIQAVAQHDTLRQSIAAEVRQAHARAQSAATQVGVAEKRVALASETRRIAEIRYRDGVGTAVEVADAQTALTSARQGLTRAQSDWGIAIAELTFALGDPVEVQP